MGLRLDSGLCFYSARLRRAATLERASDSHGFSFPLRLAPFLWDAASGFTRFG